MPRKNRPRTNVFAATATVIMTTLIAAACIDVLPSEMKLTSDDCPIPPVIINDPARTEPISLPRTCQFGVITETGDTTWYDPLQPKKLP